MGEPGLRRHLASGHRFASHERGEHRKPEHPFRARARPIRRLWRTRSSRLTEGLRCPVAPPTPMRSGWPSRLSCRTRASVAAGDRGLVCDGWRPRRWESRSRACAPGLANPLAIRSAAGRHQISLPGFATARPGSTTGAKRANSSTSAEGGRYSALDAAVPAAEWSVLRGSFDLRRTSGTNRLLRRWSSLVRPCLTANTAHLQRFRATKRGVWPLRGRRLG